MMIRRILAHALQAALDYQDGRHRRIRAEIIARHVGAEFARRSTTTAHHHPSADDDRAEDCEVN